MTSLAGLKPTLEESSLLPDDRRRRPGDVTIPAFANGAKSALDFAVRGQCQLKKLCKIWDLHLAII